MDAWETLIAGSTLASGDAWEHLNAQQGGGTATYLVLADGLGTDMSANDLDIEVSADIDATLEQTEITATIDQSQREVEI